MTHLHDGIAPPDSSAVPAQPASRHQSPLRLIPLTPERGVNLPDGCVVYLFTRPGGGLRFHTVAVVTHDSDDRHHVLVEGASPHAFSGEIFLNDITEDDEFETQGLYYDEATEETLLYGLPVPDEHVSDDVFTAPAGTPRIWGLQVSLSALIPADAMNSDDWVTAERVESVLREHLGPLHLPKLQTRPLLDTRVDVFADEARTQPLLRNVLESTLPYRGFKGKTYTSPAGTIPPLTADLPE